MALQLEAIYSYKAFYFTLCVYVYGCVHNSVLFSAAHDPFLMPKVLLNTTTVHKQGKRFNTTLIRATPPGSGEHHSVRMECGHLIQHYSTTVPLLVHPHNNQSSHGTV